MNDEIGKEHYFLIVDKVVDILQKAQKKNGMWGVRWDPNTGKSYDGKWALGNALTTEMRTTLGKLTLFSLLFSIGPMVIGRLSGIRRELYRRRPCG